jgi:hypothetical protein
VGRANPGRNGKEPRTKKMIFRLSCRGVRRNVSVTNLGVTIFAITLIGCSSQSRYTMLVPQHDPKPANCDIEIFASGQPSQQFARISRLDVHIERTYYMTSKLDDALPDLRKEGCASGADAIIDIQERSSNFNLAETNAYHVTGTGIRYLH